MSQIYIVYVTTLCRSLSVIKNIVWNWNAGKEFINKTWSLAKMKMTLIGLIMIKKYGLSLYNFTKYAKSTHSE